MKHVSIVIVNWNGYKDTIFCLDSIKKLQKNDIKLETIIVDNGSSNDSVNHILSAHPWVRLIPLTENLGFTGGNNVGIQDAVSRNADFIWLLNNDTVVDTHALSIVKAFDDESVGIAGSKIYFLSGHEYHKGRYIKEELGKVFWYAGGIIDWANMYASHKGVDEVDHGQYDKACDTEFITGCSFMMSRKVVETVGLLDEKYYLYLEDLDYCLRTVKAEFRLRFFPSSIVWHVNAGSSGGPGNSLHEYYMTRNRLYLGLRFAPFRTKIALVREAIKFLCIGGNVKKQAISDAIQGRWGKRHEK